MKNRFLLVIILFTFFINKLSSQKIYEIPLTNIKGVAVGNPKMTEEEIYLEALNEAKINAMKKAGIEENISTYQQLFTCETTDDFNEFFTSDIISEINGGVKNVEIINRIKKLNEFGNLEITVEINCTVIKYNTVKDPAFNFYTNELSNHYVSEDAFSIHIKPTQNAYVKIFVVEQLNNNFTTLLYPNEYENSKQLKTGLFNVFPTDTNKLEAYYFYTDKENEPNRIIIVLTKKEIPFTHVNIKETKADKDGYKNLPSCKYEYLLDWLLAIPRDERIVKSFNFVIYKK